MSAERSKPAQDPRGLLDAIMRVAGPVAQARHLAVPIPRRHRRAASIAIAQASAAHEPLAGFVIQDVLRTVSDTLVAFAGNLAGPPRAVVKIALTDYAGVSLDHEQHALAAIHAHPQLAGLAAMTPLPLCQGTAGGWQYAVETHVTGRALPHRLERPPTGDSCLVQSALAAAAALHRPTATARPLTDTELYELVDAPLTTVDRLHPLARRRAARPAAVERVRDELRSTLRDRTLATSYVHGDYWAGNLLLAPDVDEVAGVIDWTFFAERSLPLFDLLDLLVSAQAARQRQALGQVLAEMVGKRRWPGLLEHAARALDELPGDPVSPRTAALLYWARFVDRGLRRSPEWSRHPVWIRGNVAAVLGVMAA